MEQTFFQSAFLGERGYARVVALSTMFMTFIFGVAHVLAWEYRLHWSFIVIGLAGTVVFIRVLWQSMHPAVTFFGLVGMNLCAGLSLGSLISFLGVRAIGTATLLAVCATWILAIFILLVPRALQKGALGILVLCVSLLICLDFPAERLQWPVVTWGSVILFLWVIRRQWYEAVQHREDGAGTLDHAFRGSGGPILAVVEFVGMVSAAIGSNHSLYADRREERDSVSALPPSEFGGTGTIKDE